MTTFIPTDPGLDEYDVSGGNTPSEKPLSAAARREVLRMLGVKPKQKER